MSREQIDAALGAANAVKDKRAELRAKVRPLEYEDGRYELAAIVEDETNRSVLRSVPLPKLLRWVKRMNVTSADRTLVVVGCSEFKTFGELTDRQVALLVRALRMSPAELAAAAEDLEIKRWAREKAA